MAQMHSATRRKVVETSAPGQPLDLHSYVPDDLGDLGNLQTAIPRIAKNQEAVKRIERAVHTVPTIHRLFLGDARESLSLWAVLRDLNSMPASNWLKSQLAAMLLNQTGVSDKPAPEGRLIVPLSAINPANLRTSPDDLHNMIPSDAVPPLF